MMMSCCKTAVRKRLKMRAFISCSSFPSPTERVVSNERAYGLNELFEKRCYMKKTNERGFRVM